MWWRSQKAQLTRLSLLVIGRNFEMAANQTFLASGDILPVTHAIRGGGMFGYSQDRCCFNRPDIFVEKKSKDFFFPPSKSCSRISFTAMLNFFVTEFYSTPLIHFCREKALLGG